MPDLIVKGMGMPLGCVSCPFYCKIQTAGGTELYCKAARKEIGVDRGICPLVPLPEWHGDLIDRDALERDEIYTREYGFQDVVWATQIDDATPIIKAEGGMSNA